MAKTGIKVVVVGVIVLFACSISMLAQAAQKPAPQGVSGGSEQSSSVRDQDIEMLRADIRAQRKRSGSKYGPHSRGSRKFWPVFDQYRQEAIKANDERWALIKDYAANYNTMTDTQAQDCIKRSTGLTRTPRITYEVRSVFEGYRQKTALWYQIDRRIDLLINCGCPQDSDGRYKQVTK